MTENILKLRTCFDELFGEEYDTNCLIEIENDEHAVTLAANREGMLYLINRLIELCEYNNNWKHYHLDEAGMASKCNKPVIISFIKED